jgi:hypothetical protein
MSRLPWTRLEHTRTIRVLKIGKNSDYNPNKLPNTTTKAEIFATKKIN